MVYQDRFLFIHRCSECFHIYDRKGIIEDPCNICKHKNDCYTDKEGNKLFKDDFGDKIYCGKNFIWWEYDMSIIEKMFKEGVI